MFLLFFDNQYLKMKKKKNAIVNSRNEGFAEGRMLFFPRPDWTGALQSKLCSAAVSWSKALTNFVGCTAVMAMVTPASGPPLELPGLSFWGWVAILHRCRAVGSQPRTHSMWWTLQLCIHGWAQWLSEAVHVQENVLCQKVIFLEREELMWFYWAACSSYVWLCGVVCMSGSGRYMFPTTSG